jgi:hypothetical protein
LQLWKLFLETFEFLFHSLVTFARMQFRPCEKVGEKNSNDGSLSLLLFSGHAGLKLIQDDMEMRILVAFTRPRN